MTRATIARIGRELTPQELLERQIENRLRFGPPVDSSPAIRLRIPARTWRDDVRELFHDIRLSPESHAFAFALGVFVTCGSMIALAKARGEA